MFDRHLRIPADMLSGTGGPTIPDSAVHLVNRHPEQLHYVYRKASHSLQKAADKSKRLYDWTAREALLLRGNQALILDQGR